MRATSVMRFVIFGAVGFGVGGAIGTVTLLVPLVGAIGGAFLGLALKDGRKAGIFALLGDPGTYLGFIGANVAVMAGLFVGNPTGKAAALGLWSGHRWALAPCRGTYRRSIARSSPGIP